MTEPRLPPDDPREWLNRARSNLSQARGGGRLPDVYLEDLCFQAQQAVEKALKGILLSAGEPVPRTHDLARLLHLIRQAGRTVPERILRVSELTDYAVAARYPGTEEVVSTEEYEEIVALATEVFRWAEDLIGPGRSAGGEESA